MSQWVMVSLFGFTHSQFGGRHVPRFCIINEWVGMLKWSTDSGLRAQQGSKVQ